MRSIFFLLLLATSAFSQEPKDAKPTRAGVIWIHGDDKQFAPGTPFKDEKKRAEAFFNDQLKIPKIYSSELCDLGGSSASASLEQLQSNIRKALRDLKGKANPELSLFLFMHGEEEFCADRDESKKDGKQLGTSETARSRELSTMPTTASVSRQTCGLNVSHCSSLRICLRRPRREYGRPNWLSVWRSWGLYQAQIRWRRLCTSLGYEILFPYVARRFGTTNHHGL